MNSEPALLVLGWSDFFRSQLTPDEIANAVVARVVEPLRGLSRVAGVFGEIWAETSSIVGLGVGDWVVGRVRSAGDKESRLTVARVLNRKTKLSRTAPSQKNYEQILCANADTVFIVVALSQEFHLPGVLRAVEASRLGGLQPVLVITKADAGTDSSAIVSEVKTALNDLTIHVVSVNEKIGVADLDLYFRPGKTVVLLGASGAGKSTLTNHFIQSETQLVSGTREKDEKGRHTTTARRLHFLPSGGMIVDSPGIRELQLWKEPVSSPVEKNKRPPKRAARYDHNKEEDNDDDGNGW